MSARGILLAAGGTGGHLFPAASLAAVLKKRGYEIDLATDDRALKYGGEFPARAIHAIPSATPTGAGLASKALAALKLGQGSLVARGLIKKLNPLVVVGFGGYPTVPPLLAAAWLGAPSVLHEQNAVMGRANKFLAGRVSLIATGFPNLKGVDAGKTRYVGNPVRPAVLAAALTPYPARDGGRLNVLVTGGSQGARVMSDIVPAALALLSAEQRAGLRLTMQARGEDLSRVAAAAAKLAFPVELQEFFADLPGRIAASHLVIGRAGASTVERTRRHRPALDPGAVSACARSGSGGQCGDPRRERRCDGDPAEGVHSRASCGPAESRARRAAAAGGCCGGGESGGRLRCGRATCRRGGQARPVGVRAVRPYRTTTPACPARRRPESTPRHPRSRRRRPL